MPNKLKITEFKKQFSKIKKMGWIKSNRRGPTGIGQTLEYLLGLTENNIALPDLGTIELKTHREGSSSMITLFTFNRKAWKIKPLDAVRKYGTPDENGRLGLYYTMSRTPNSVGLFLHLEKEEISVRHISGEIIAVWNLNTLSERFMQKIPGLVLVSAFSEMRGDIEWFKFERAQLLTETSSEIIKNHIYSQDILFDLRLKTQSKVNEARFRVKDDKLCWLFGTRTEI